MTGSRHGRPAAADRQGPRRTHPALPCWAELPVAHTAQEVSAAHARRQAIVVVDPDRTLAGGSIRRDGALSVAPSISAPPTLGTGLWLQAVLEAALAGRTPPRAT